MVGEMWSARTSPDVITRVATSPPYSDRVQLRIWYTKANVTEIYAERDQALATSLAEEIG